MFAERGGADIPAPEEIAAPVLALRGVSSLREVAASAPQAPRKRPARWRSSPREVASRLREVGVVTVARNANPT